MRVCMNFVSIDCMYVGIVCQQRSAHNKLTVTVNHPLQASNPYVRGEIHTSDFYG
uniref:Uncharacterized protein n=1 Tax=Picea sitchensis TaxID=3332 RepID=C0PSA3_PICSI|nr:unknown [Picea sitchensis]